MATIATRYKRSVMVVALPSLVAVVLVGGAFALREPWLGRGGQAPAPSVTIDVAGGAEQALASEFVTAEHPREELFAPSWPQPATNAAGGRTPTAAGKIALPPAPPRATAPIAGVAVRWVQSPKLGLDHGIESLGLTPANELDSPHDGSYRIGWYPDYGTPGEGGNAVLSAHESWNHLQGPFYFVSEAAPRDEIVVELADGRRLRYEVMSNVRYEVHKLPMGELLWPSTRPAGQEWLTLITCGGRIVYDATGYGEYLDRDVVVARRVS